MRSLVLMGGAAVALMLSACHGPLPAQTFGMEPITDRGPYKSRLADYKLRGEPCPADARTAMPAADRNASRRPANARKGQRPRVRKGRVNLRKQDLQSVHDWFSGRNRQFILGDVVEIEASKEFFSQVLTANAQVGMVRKSEREINGDRVITLTYIGAAIPSAMHSPRVLIGVGFTASARKTLHIKLSKTYDAARPVRIRITARGDAARGRGDDVLQKDDHQLTVQGALTWNRQLRRWTWSCG